MILMMTLILKETKIISFPSNTFLCLVEGKIIKFSGQLKSHWAAPVCVDTDTICSLSIKDSCQAKHASDRAQI